MVLIWTVIEAKQLQLLWDLAEPGTSSWAAEMEAILGGAMGWGAVMMSARVLPREDVFGI